MKTRKTTILFIGILLFIICSKNIFATRQAGDILFIGRNRAEIVLSPLWSYFEKKGERTIGEINLDNIDSSTALWRGFRSTWKLENDSLFLTRIEDGNFNDLDMKSEFGSNRVFAQWFTGTIAYPIGRMVHRGVIGVDTFEDVQYLTFEQGRLVRTSTIELLRNAIKSQILNSINMIERGKFTNSAFIQVMFDENGKIDFITT